MPGQEIAFGAVTKPWQANVRFRSIPPEAFRAFREPDYVKIAWSLSVKPLSANRSLVCTQTRVATTDAAARARFRRYWAFISPGILLIRYAALRTAKQQAESAWGPHGAETSAFCESAR